MPEALLLTQGYVAAAVGVTVERRDWDIEELDTTEEQVFACMMDLIGGGLLFGNPVGDGESDEAAVPRPFVHDELASGLNRVEKMEMQNSF